MCVCVCREQLCARGGRADLLNTGTRSIPFHDRAVLAGWLAVLLPTDGWCTPKNAVAGVPMHDER